MAALDAAIQGYGCGAGWPGSDPRLSGSIPQSFQHRHPGSGLFARYPGSLQNLEPKCCGRPRISARALSGVTSSEERIFREVKRTGQPWVEPGHDKGEETDYTLFRGNDAEGRKVDSHLKSDALERFSHHP
jgi:hypothetical protein